MSIEIPCHEVLKHGCESCSRGLQKRMNQYRRELDEARAEIERLKRNYWAMKPEWVEHLAKMCDSHKLHGDEAKYPSVGAAIRAQQAEIERLTAQVGERDTVVFHASETITRISSERDRLREQRDALVNAGATLQEACLRAMSARPKTFHNREGHAVRRALEANSIALAKLESQVHLAYRAGQESVLQASTDCVYVHELVDKLKALADAEPEEKHDVQ